MLSDSPFTRRRVLIGGGAAIVAAAGATHAYRTRDLFEGDAIDPVVAHQSVSAGKLILIDIRRPDEWAKTGIGEGAIPIDMRRDDFVDELHKVVNGDRAKAVALICARGVRSDHMSARLIDAGFTNIIDVPEGMLGSRSGPGWIKRDLPLVKG